jgi:hypothetical protein
MDLNMVQRSRQSSTLLLDCVVVVVACTYVVPLVCVRYLWLGGSEIIINAIRHHGIHLVDLNNVWT